MTGFSRAVGLKVSAAQAVEAKIMGEFQHEDCISAKIAENRFPSLQGLYSIKPEFHC
jgi:hypothetical protein